METYARKKSGYRINMGYPIIVKNKNEIYNALSEEQIECRPLVAGSMGMQPAWVNLYGESAMPNATVIDEQGMYLPNHQDLTEEGVLDICSIINKEAIMSEIINLAKGNGDDHVYEEAARMASKN